MAKAIIERKIAEVEALQNKLQEATTVVIFEYKGLTVEKFTQLRTELRKDNIEVKIYKNNITRRAAQAAGFDGLVDSLVGPLAVAISYDDVVAPAKTVYDFAKGNKQVAIRSGIIEGAVVASEQLVELANLPSRETLLTQLGAGLLAPVKDLSIGLNLLSEENN